MSFTQQELTTGAASWNYSMIGRLKHGISPSQAQIDAERVAQQTMRNYPSWMSSLRINAVVQPLHEEIIREARPLLRTLFFAVAVVLLIACVNLAGLLLVRAIRRRREIAVRLALGARGSALLRQAALETLVLSMAGGLLGLLLAAGMVRVGVSLLPETLPRINEIRLDWQVVAFALSLAILTGIVCALAPGFAAMQTNMNEMLKEGGRTGTSGGGHARLRSALVIAEIAIAMVLLTASGLLLRSFEKMRAASLGFRPDHTLTASYSLPRKQYGTQAAVNEFNHELLLRIERLPGMRSVGLTSRIPASNLNSNQAYIAEGALPPKGGGMTLATPITVAGDYFSAMGIPLLRGRLFTDADNEKARLVVIVNRKLAQDSWPGQDPIGKRIRIGTKDMKMPWLTVVGEVADAKEGSPDEPDKDQFYQSLEQLEASYGSMASPEDINGSGGYIALRTAMPPEQVENSLRFTVRSLDPQLPLNQIQTMEHVVSGSEAPRRFNTALISAFAATAVMLAILGIYSVIAFSVALRVQEMAIRTALGAQRSSIRGLVLASGAKLAVTGCAIGIAGAVAASQLLRSFLFEVSPFDPLVLALAAIAVLLLALGASLPSAERAASIDPMRALRME